MRLLQSIWQYFMWCYFRTHVMLNDGFTTSDRPWHLCTSNIFFADIWHTDLGPRIKIGGDPGPKNWLYFPNHLLRHLPPPPVVPFTSSDCPLPWHFLFSLEFQDREISLVLTALEFEELVWSPSLILYDIGVAVWHLGSLKTNMIEHFHNSLSKLCTP